MFCYQCQEANQNSGCTTNGVCGKSGSTADLQDLLIFTLKGTAVYAKKLQELEVSSAEQCVFFSEALFSTITNANFDDAYFTRTIKKALVIREELRIKFLEIYEKKNQTPFTGLLEDCAVWYSDNKDEFLKKAQSVGVLSAENEDIRSLRQLLTYGLKGIAAYAYHAKVLGFEDVTIYQFMFDALAATTEDLSVDELVAIVLKSGEIAVNAMKLLDEANTTTYGHPEITKVNLGTGKNPGILISGHDLKDIEELLKQTEGQGVDVYTHSEMLPAHYYPAFKKYSQLVGNYGGAWWKQNNEFATFNGPILMTTNCITPVQDAYKNRIFTTGVTGYPGIKHIPEGSDGKKDFSDLIQLAKTCPAPQEIEQGEITGGFAHNQTLALADKIVDAVKQGHIRKFVVMAGCDGRQKSRDYFTDVAQSLPKDAVILTAGCAKYRYNKLDLGDIGGIPRILDAGQCNDCYSLVVIALKLKEVFELDDINDLPICFDIGWYEQKAVAVLLALLSLGVKSIRLGPTLPAFLSPNVVKVLVDNFDIKPITTAAQDVEAMTGEVAASV